MGFLKRNYFVILCGVAGVTGIGLTVTFMGCMAEIETQMQEAATLHNNIENAGRNPRSLSGIQKIENITTGIQKELGRVLKLAIEANVREPLRDDVFPKVAEQNIPYRFKTDYINAFTKMMRQLNPDAPAGMTNFSLPTPDEITSWQIEIDSRLSAGVEQKPNQPKQRKGPGRGIRFDRRQKLGQSTVGGTIDDRTPEELAREDPYQMAHLAKARAIHCYVGIESFQRSDLYYETRVIHGQDMWAAQVLLWIQQDVIKALAAANRRAVAQLAEVNKPLPEDARLPADVATMAVKHVQGIQLTLPEVYEASGAMGAAGGAGGAQPFAAPGAAPAGGVGLGALTITGRSSNELYDVVPFAVTLVIDQRDLLLVIDEIAQANFFTLLNQNYQMLPPDEERGDGYLYGHEPVVTVALEFEAYFFRDVYHWRWPKGGPKKSADGLPPDELQNHPFMPDDARAGVTAGMGLELRLGFSGPGAAGGAARGNQGGFGQRGFGQRGYRGSRGYSEEE